MNHFIEIRSLTLKPGTREQFHRLYVEEALPRQMERRAHDLLRFSDDAVQ